MSEGKGTARPCESTITHSKVRRCQKPAGHDLNHVSAGMEWDDFTEDKGAIPAPWYVGVMNDCVFIINKPPRPSTDEVWHDRPNGPEVICKMGPTKLDEANAALIVPRVNGWEALVAERDALKADVTTASGLLQEGLLHVETLERERDSLKRTVEELRAALEVVRSFTSDRRFTDRHGLGKIVEDAIAKSAEVGHQK